MFREQCTQTLFAVLHIDTHIHTHTRGGRTGIMWELFLLT